MAERLTVDQEVAGSKPVRHPTSVTSSQDDTKDSRKGYTLPVVFCVVCVMISHLLKFVHRRSMSSGSCITHVALLDKVSGDNLETSTAS